MSLWLHSDFCCHIFSKVHELLYWPFGKKKKKRSKLKRHDWWSILLDTLNMRASRFPPPVESIMLSAFLSQLQPSCSWLVGCSSNHPKTNQIQGSEDGPASFQSWITAIQLLCELYRRRSIWTGDNWRRKDNTVTAIKVALHYFAVTRRHNVKTCQV